MTCKVHYNYLLAVLKIKMGQHMSSSCTLFLTCFPARAECCGCLLVAWEVSDKKRNCVSADTDSCKRILHARQAMSSFHGPGTIIQMDEWMRLRWHVDVKNGFSGENSMETLKPRLSKYRFQRHDSAWNSPGMWLFVSTKRKDNLFGSHTRQLSLSGSLLSLRSVRLPPWDTKLTENFTLSSVTGAISH